MRICRGVDNRYRPAGNETIPFEVWLLLLSIAASTEGSFGSSCARPSPLNLTASREVLPKRFSASTACASGSISTVFTKACKSFRSPGAGALFPGSGVFRVGRSAAIMELIATRRHFPGEEDSVKRILRRTTTTVSFDMPSQDLATGLRSRFRCGRSHRIPAWGVSCRRSVNAGTLGKPEMLDQCRNRLTFHNEREPAG